MNNKFRSMVIMSIKRRKKEIARVSMIAFLAAFFIMSTLLFQDNVDSYQQKTNRLNYGEWFLSETTKGSDPASVLTENAYFDKYGTMWKGPVIGNTKYFLGTADETMIDIGHIRLRSGHMPENDHEIVMQLNLMALLGLNSEVGQTVNLSYMDGNGKLIHKDYVISGILVNYTDNWINGSDLPAALVTKQCFEEINVVATKTYMYHIRESINIKSDIKFVDYLCSAAHEQLVYNKFAYEKGIWGDLNAYWQIIIVLVFMSTSALIYTYFSYISKRKSEYYRLRCFGITRFQLKRLVMYEGLYACVPAAIIGFVLAFLLTLILTIFLKIFFHTEFFFYFKLTSLLLCIICITATIILSILVVMLLVNDKNIYENTFKISLKKIKRLKPKRLNHRNLGMKMHRREWRLFPLRKLLTIALSIAITTFILLCFNKLHEYYVRGYSYYVDKVDFNADVQSKKQQYIVNETEEHPIKSSKELNSYADSFPDDFYDSLNAIAGVQSVEYFTVDSSKVITWDDIKNSEIRSKQYTSFSQSLKLKSIAEENKEYVYAYASVFYPNAYKIYEKYKDKIPSNYYDPEAFQRGEQVIYFMSNIDSQGLGSKESSLSIGDKISYHTASGDVQATVVAKIYSDDTPFLHFNSRYEYDFLASQALGEKIAAADHQKFGYNRLKLIINPYVSFSGTNKRITNLLSEYKLDFQSNYEKKIQMRDDFYQRAFIFGMIITIVFSIYLVIYTNMIASEMKYKKYNLKLLKNLGATNGKLAWLEIRKCIWDNLWILLAFPIVYALTYLNNFLYINEHWGVILATRTSVSTISKYEAALNTTQRLSISIPIALTITILIFIILLIVAIVPIVKYIRNMKKEN